MRVEGKVVGLLIVACLGAYVLGAFAVTTYLDGSEDESDLLADLEDDAVEGTGELVDPSLEFEDITEDAGIEYRSRRPPELEAVQSMNGHTGAYVTDYDDDGRQDVLVIGDREPVLFENRGGSFVETDAVPSVEGFVRAALFFDADGDGREDLLLLRMDDTPALLENRGDSFEQVDAGFDARTAVPISAAAADYTGNGCLDVFVIQNGDWSNERPNGLREYDVPSGGDNGNPNYLFRNDCESFTEVSDEAGLTGEHWTLATSFVDLNGDGLPDIHQANDFNNDVVYHNNGDGTFERVELGDRTNRNGMSSVVGDVSGNGHPDLFVTNIWFPDRVWERIELYSMDLRAEGNNLLLNRGDGTFEEAAAEYGVEVGGWGWAGVLADLDNDGDLDAFHTARDYSFTFADRRFSREEAEAIRDTYPVFEYPVLFQRTDGEFASVDPEAAGFTPMDGRGVAEFDATGNGKLDLLIANNDGEFKLFANRADGGNSVIVELERSETVPATGAEITVSADGETYHRFVESNSDYLSQGTRRAHVGLGTADTVTVTVTWADGSVDRYADLSANQEIVLEPSGLAETRAW